METSIMDLVNFLKQERKDTTITKYMNIISQVCKFGQRKGLIKALPNIPTSVELMKKFHHIFLKILNRLEIK